MRLHTCQRRPNFCGFGYLRVLTVSATSLGYLRVLTVSATSLGYLRVLTVSATSLGYLLVLTVSATKNVYSHGDELVPSLWSEADVPGKHWI